MIPIEIQYPPIGSLIHIDQATELVGFSPDSGSIGAVVDENTFGIVLSHGSLEHGVSIEVMIGTECWSILHRYTLQDRELGYWPFAIVSENIKHPKETM